MEKLEAGERITQDELQRMAQHQALSTALAGRKFVEESLAMERAADEQLPQSSESIQESSRAASRADPNLPDKDYLWGDYREMKRKRDQLNLEHAAKSHDIALTEAQDVNVDKRIAIYGLTGRDLFYFEIPLDKYK